MGPESYSAESRSITAGIDDRRVDHFWSKVLNREMLQGGRDIQHCRRLLWMYGRRSPRKKYNIQIPIKSTENPIFLLLLLYFFGHCVLDRLYKLLNITPAMFV